MPTIVREGRPPRPRGEPANMLPKRAGEEKQANPATPPGHAQAINRLRRQRFVERLHRLGPLPLYHFLNEIECGAVVAEHLEKYARLDPDFIATLGGTHFGPPIYVIDGGRRP
jgi:hypothetical protein